MKILITGANGYLGTGVAKALKQFNQELILTDIAVNGLDGKIGNVIETDLFKIEDPFTFFGQPDVIVHLAWRNGFVHNSPSHMEDLHLHYDFISKMCKSGVKKVVALGSMHEIGFYEGRICDSTPCNPLSLYGIAKNALRQSVSLCCKENNVLFQWIRGFYIVGNTEKGQSIFSKIALAEKEGKTNFPFTTGKNQYDFLNYDDFCLQIANVVINNNVLGIINCCSGSPESLASRVERFIKDNNYKIKLEYGKFPDRPYDSLAVWGDSTKINEIIKENNIGVKL